MDESDKKQILSAIRATVGSKKGGVPLHELNRDYRDLEGRNIPFREFGCASLEAFIKSLANDFTISNRGGELVVFAKVNESTAHLQELINKQKTVVKKRKPNIRSYRGKYQPAGSFSSSKPIRKPFPLKERQNSYSKPFNGFSNRSSGYDLREKISKRRSPEPGPPIRRERSPRRPSPQRRSPGRRFSPQRRKSPIRYSSRRSPSPSYHRRSSPSRRHSPQRRSSPSRKSPSRRHSPRKSSRHRRSPSPSYNRRSSPARRYSSPKRSPSPPRRLSPKRHSPRRKASPPRSESPPKKTEQKKSGRLSTVPTPSPTPASVSAPSAGRRLLGPKPEDLVSKGREKQKLKELQVTIPNDQYKPYPNNHLRNIAAVPVVTPNMPVAFSKLNIEPEPGMPIPTVSNMQVSYNSRVSSNLPSSPGYPQLPPSSMSPALSNATTSSSSSPEMYQELVNASPQDQLIHLCKYLFHEEPQFQVNANAKSKQFYGTIKMDHHAHISTLPDDYPSREKALQEVIKLALAKFNKLKDEKIARGQKKITTSPSVIVDRIYSIVRKAESGLFTAKIEQLYQTEYGEVLPENWVQYPEVQNSPRLDVDNSGITIIVYALKPAIPFTSSSELPPLILPEEDEWPVNVLVMNSVSELCVRLLDEAYIIPSSQLEDRLKEFMTTMKLDPVEEVQTGELYCIFEDDIWIRVRVEGEERMADGSNKYLCKLIDLGEESYLSQNELYPLYDQFRDVAAQAFTIFLPETQDFADFFDSADIVDAVVGRPFIAVVQSRELKHVTLYNTEDDPPSNINHYIFEQICKKLNVLAVPDENMHREKVFVSYISNKESCIYVQIESLMFDYLLSSIRELATYSDLTKFTAASSLEIEENKDQIFLAKYSLDGEFYRATILEINPISKLVTVLFVDYGNKETVHYSSLIKLFATPKSHLVYIPFQSIKIQLSGIPTFTSDVQKLLSKYLNGDEPVILRKAADGAQIHKRNSEGKIININGLILSESTGVVYESPAKCIPQKPEIDTSPLDPPVIPPVGKLIDVLLETVSTPTNFWIQPVDMFNDLMDLLENMDEFYSENLKQLPSVKFEDVKKGASFACFHKEKDSWQRVMVSNLISSDNVALFFVDFGEIQTAEISQLVYLTSQFRSLPAVAIRSKLHDIYPSFGDWSFDDILKFKDLLTVNKTFKCKIEDSTPDLINDRRDVQVSIRLIDTHGEKDLDIAKYLVEKGIAKMKD